MLKRIETHDVLADAIVKACCVLHNFLIEMRGVEPYMVDHGQRNETNGLWRRAGEMRSVSVMRNARANRARDEAVEMRNKLTDFFLVLAPFFGKMMLFNIYTSISFFAFV